MKIKQILYLFIFISIISGIYAYSGTSSSYTMTFNTGHVLEDSNSTSYDLNLDSLICGVGKSQNYIMRFGSLSFDSAEYFILPQITVSSITNNSEYNVSKLSINLVANFSKGISSLIYEFENSQIDLTNEITINYINTSIDIARYGQNTLKLTFIDYYHNENSIELVFNATLYLNGTQNDTDGDGINNTYDTINGNTQNINTNLNNLSVKVNNTTNLSQIFNQTYNVTFTDQDTNQTLVEFTNNFSANSIDLTNITLKTDTTTNAAKIFIRGLKLEPTKTKTMYLQLQGNTTKYGSICLKDSDIYSFSDITSDCSAADETYIQTIPFSNSNYVISYQNETSKIVKIMGLTHSAIMQICTENWVAGAWSACVSSSQSRTYTDANNCGTTFNNPYPSGETRTCTTPSSPGGSSPSKKDPDNDGWIPPPSVYTNVTKKEKVENEITTPTKTITNNYEIKIGTSNDLTQKYSGKQIIVVRHKSTGEKLMEFNHNFSQSKLDLSKMEILTKNVNGENYIIVKNLDAGKEGKTLRLPVINNSGKVCVKDTEVSSIKDVSENCNAYYEVVLNCRITDVTNNRGFDCKMENGYYVLTGLKHTAVVEYTKTPETQSSTSTSQQSSNKNQQDIKNSQNTSQLLYYLGIGFVTILILVLLFVLVSKKKYKEYEQADPNQIPNTYKAPPQNVPKPQSNIKQYNISNINYSNVSSRNYHQAKDYVSRYKNSYNPEQLRKALESAGYNQDEINLVLEEMNK